MNFLYRISIRKRMSLILLAFLIPIAVLTYDLYIELKKDISFTEMELKGTAYTKPLLSLLDEVADFQMAALLAKDGDKEAEKEMPEALKGIDKVIAELIEIDSKLGKDLSVTDKTEFAPILLKKKWENIKANQLSSEAYESFFKDNSSLIAYIADKSNLILDPELDTYYLMDAATAGAPAMLSELAKIKYTIFKYLHEENNQIASKDKSLVSLELGLIKTIYLPKVINGVKTALANDAVANGVNPTLEPTMSKALSEYASTTEKLNITLESLVNGESMTPSAFIEIADKSHDGTATLANAALDELEKMLSIRIVNLKYNIALILGICALSLVIAFAMFFMISASIVKPIIRLQEIMEGMIDGKLEIVVPGQDYKDETGAMARCVESFRKSGIEKIRLEADNIEKEKRAKEDKIKASHDLAANFEARMKGIIQAVAAAATELYHTSESMTHLTTEACRKVASVKGTSEQTSQNVNTVASAAEEMAASIREVAQQVMKSSGAVKSSVAEVDKADKTSGLLQESAEKIGNVVELIRDISEQINLLALNATIESARAGEAGKGFAVVASEVKNLAGQASKATEEISQYVENIQSVSTGVLGGLQSIKSSIADVETFSTAISTAVEEQSAATKEIAQSMSTAASGSEQITRDIVDVNKASTEAGVSADQVLQAAKMLSVESEKLNSEVEQFINELKNG